MARTQRPYRKARKPNLRVAGTSITAPVPSAEQRAKRALIDAQHATEREPTNRKRRAKVRACELLHYYPSDETYAIRVKVTGTKRTDYRLPYLQASRLWREHGEGEFSDAIRNLVTGDRSRRTCEPRATEPGPSQPIRDHETAYWRRVAGWEN